MRRSPRCAKSSPAADLAALLRSGAVLLGALLLVGCSADAPTDDSPSTRAGSPAPPTTSGPPPTTALPFELPETCSGLLTLDAIDAALGVRITGTTQYLVGQPEPGIGRTGRVTCSYGVIPNGSGPSSPPLVQASVFTYESAEAALDRVETVVSQGRDAGNRVEDVPVEQYVGVLIVSVIDATLVLAVEDRNYAITLAAGLVTDDRLAQAMAGLAVSVVNGGQPAPSPAPTAVPTGTPSPTS